MIDKSSFCESCGWERYYHINYDGQKSGNFYRNNSSVSFPRVNSQKSTHLGVYDLAEYDGKLYYYEKDKCYLFSSRIDGTDQKVLRQHRIYRKNIGFKRKTPDK